MSEGLQSALTVFLWVISAIGIFGLGFLIHKLFPNFFEGLAKYFFAPVLFGLLFICAIFAVVYLYYSSSFIFWIFLAIISICGTSIAFYKAWHKRKKEANRAAWIKFINEFVADLVNEKFKHLIPPAHSLSTIQQIKKYARTAAFEASYSCLKHIIGGNGNYHTWPELSYRSLSDEELSLLKFKAIEACDCEYAFRQSLELAISKC